ncbi:Dual-specificity RNA methyltransferase RlmN [Glycine soja]
MKHWMSMRRMAVGAVSNSTLFLPSSLLSSSKPNPLTIPFSFSLTKTSPFSISVLTRQRRFLSVSSLTADHHNLSDFGDGDSVAISNEGLKMLLKGMTYPELEKWVQSHGYRPGQAMMLWKRMYGNNIWAHHIDELEDGLVIETVVIPCDRGRTTVMGLRRHLTAAEIVEQAVFARRLLTDEVGSITNVVFMGMGEPLHNIDNVIKAADIMVDEQGLQFSPRKVTISTSGLVPQLKRFLHESNCALAVSLNATTDERWRCREAYRACEGNSLQD